MNNPILLIDTWEAGGEISESVLLNNRITGMLVRINDMNGGHHRDEGFNVQWEQASVLPVRIPYFVYNPWVSGKENFEWLWKNMPTTAKGVAIDVEVEKSGYSSVEYAKQLNEFLTFTSDIWKCMIYTGERYINMLSPWPKNYPYWWAQYPNALYPAERQSLSWAALREKLLPFSGPTNASKVPGPLKMWQCSGDRYLMDGCSKAMDVNVWMGTMEELQSFAASGGTSVPEDPDKLIETHKYYDGAVYEKHEIMTSHGRSTYHVLIVENNKAEYFVSPQLSSRMYTPDFLTKYNLDFAVNGDGFVSTTIAGYGASEGKPYGKLGVEEPLYISKENQFSLDRPGQVWNAISHPNRLVIEGKIVKINKALDDIRARTAFGYTQDQKKSIFLWCDGADYAVKEGLNFPECAEILLKFGCYMGFMHDGGGSTTAAIRTDDKIKILGTPYGEDIVDRFPGYKMRRVANVLGLRMKTNSIPNDPIPEGETMNFKVVTSARFRSIPSMNTQDKGLSSSVGETFQSETVNSSDPNVSFVKHPNGMWLPLVWLGTEYTKQVTSTTPIPDEDGEPPVVPFPADVVVVKMEFPVGVVPKVFINNKEYKA